jgi:hypothetical protein
MKEKDSNTGLTGKEENSNHTLMLYPVNEDIYSKSQNEQDIDPEDISRNKEPNENDKAETGNEKDFNDDVSGSDLDIPGSEADDDRENTGNEDEENNYYSIGGDDHNDLEENKGE